MGTFCLYMAEILLLKVTDVAKTITITPSLYLLVYFLLLFLLKHPFPQGRKEAEICRKMSNYTYYSHVLFFDVFTSLNTALWGDRLTETPMFLLVVAATVVTGLVFIRSDKKICRLLVG